MRLRFGVWLILGGCAAGLFMVPTLEAQVFKTANANKLPSTLSPLPRVAPPQKLPAHDVKVAPSATKTDAVKPAATPKTTPLPVTSTVPSATAIKPPIATKPSMAKPSATTSPLKAKAVTRPKTAQIAVVQPYSLPANARPLTLNIPISLQDSLKNQLPDRPQRAEDVYGVFNQSNLALRMEALRRAAQYLSADEKAKLWVYLNKRRDQNINDANLYFDVGYADITLRMNKTGLFFLRKACERLKNPFASMAYAMAQVDVDLLLEGGKPDAPSYRKLDVVYKLGDAISLDVKKHYPGLWPTFVRIQQQLAQYPAYTDFSQRDYSDTYIPFGERPKLYAATPSVNCNVWPSQPDLLPGNKPGKASSGPQPVRPLYSQPVVMGSGVQCIDFFPRSGQHYDVTVRNGEKVLGNLESPVGVGIIEDLDKDGTYELVIRQFRVDPFHPILVYRFSDATQIQLDSALQQQWFD